MSRAGRFLFLYVVPPLVLFVAVVLLWAAVIRVFEVKPFIAPAPPAVWRAAMENLPELGRATWMTAKSALAGFAASLLVGTLISFLFSQSILIQRAAYPYAIFLQTVPIVAIAPIVILWFGNGFQSVSAIAFIVSLFPIITAGTTGLTEVDGNAVELFAVNDASRVQVLLKLRLPNAVPYLLTGAKTSSGLSVIGAIVGEFFAGFGGEGFGLGYLIYLTNGQLKTSYLFASIITSTLLGLAIFGAVSLAGRLVLLRWRET